LAGFLNCYIYCYHINPAHLLGQIFYVSDSKKFFASAKYFMPAMLLPLSVLSLVNLLYRLNPRYAGIDRVEGSWVKIFGNFLVALQVGPVGFGLIRFYGNVTKKKWLQVCCTVPSSPVRHKPNLNQITGLGGSGLGAPGLGEGGNLK
jgi:hypothetical protein